MGSRGVRTPPVLLWKVDPDYSDPARAAKVQGIVVLLQHPGEDPLVRFRADRSPCP
jgi:hypothetical protein